MAKGNAMIINNWGGKKRSPIGCNVLVTNEAYFNMKFSRNRIHEVPILLT